MTDSFTLRGVCEFCDSIVYGQLRGDSGVVKLCSDHYNQYVERDGYEKLVCPECGDEKRHRGQIKMCESAHAQERAYRARQEYYSW